MALPSTSPTGGRRFLLLDRPDPNKIFTDIEESTPTLEHLPLFDYSQEMWNKARESVESGKIREQLPVTQEIIISTETPSPPPGELEFKEYQTTLSLTGRKVIGFNYSGKSFINEQKTITRPKSSSAFEINQQLQLRMQGKVGEKITVNVDYDDTKQDKQDISVVYQGDPQEVVQNVAFGDIDLSLPATEFVSYNKQLFGIRADLKAKNAKFTIVGSRTKGQTRVRQFIGNTQFQAIDILDSQYLRRQYYDITFGNTARLPIKQGSEKIYIDRQTQQVVDNITIFEMTGDDLAVQSSSYTGKFQLLNPGIDYIMDYAKGILMFTRSLNPQDVIIIDFENANGTKLSQNPSTSSLTTGGTGNYKIIKTVNDIYISSSSEVGYKRELKTYYSIGQTNIVRDDGRGNFVLKVQDFNRQEVGSTLSPVQKYPDTIHVDFEQGKFYLDHVFTLEGSNEPDPQIYSPSPIAKRIIRVEYYYRFKTFMLEPNIVLQSEIVRIDGKEKKRNQDYFIDYDSGFITFYYPETIKQDSVIEITYEVSPFGGLGNVSLAGARASYDLGSHISLGSTLLYQGGFKPNTVPSVSDLTNSITVIEGDLQFKNINFLGIKSNFNVEAAQSINNPNLYDYALIDNMEGIMQEDSPSMDHNFWYIASNPTEGPSDPDAITWKTENIKATDINSQAGSEDTQQVLSINYDFSISTEVSIVYPFSSSGLDFSQKNILELVLYGNYSPSNPGPQINIHLGQINEDPDNSGGQNFTCASGISLTGAPKSEDENCDGQLGTNEDDGWEYKVGTKSKRYGAGNGRIDTTDLDKNGRLDTESPMGGSFGYRFNKNFIDNNDNGAQKSTVDFSGWHTWYVPLNIASTDTYKWSAIKQVRISLKKSFGGATSGTIKFARISVIGNSWYVQQSTAPGKLDVLSVNNVNTPQYIPIYNASEQQVKQVFEDLYGSVSEQKERTNSTILTEQSLAINYTNIVSSSTSYVYKKFLRTIDISQHEKFRFLLYSTATSNAYFYLKVGNENNYHQVEIPLNFTGWRLYSIEQKDVTKDGIPEEWQDKSDSSYGVVISSKGSPNLQQVSIIMAGVLAKDENQYSGIIYLNEIHLKESKKRKGQALKAEGNFEIPGWFSFGGKHRKVDRNFQTPVTVITNQDNEQNNAYLNISRISFFPMSFNVSKQITETPNTYLTGNNNNIVTSLQGGIVKRFDGTATGNINIARLPNIGLNYGINKIEYILLKRKDNKNTYSGNFNYNVPLKFFIVPRTVNANYSLSTQEVNYEETSFNIAQNLANTKETAKNYGIKLSFVPWSGSSFNPGYSYQEIQEEKSGLAMPRTFHKYPKSSQQTVELNSNLRFFSWFNPSINYSISTIENNNLTVTTVTVAQSSGIFNVGDIKTITRNSQGSIGLNINMNELMPKNKLLRSMMLSSNYQIQDGDTWQNIEKEFDSRKYLWIRDSLKPAQKLAQRTNLTKRDTISSNQRWQPFEGYAFKGRYSPLNTLSITNNFINSVQRSETTGTQSKTINRTFPDMVVSFSQIETLTRTEKWTQSATLNFKFSKNSNENVNINLETSRNYGIDLRFRLLNFMDTAMSYNLRLSDKKNLRLNLLEQKSRHNDATLQGTFGIKKFTFTPKIDFSSDFTETGIGVKTQDLTTITPSILTRTDLQVPKGLKLPFIKKTPVTLTNRIIWTTTLSYAIKKSKITIAENSRLLSFNTSADYEATTNLRITFNAAVKRFWHKYLKQEEYLEYQAGSTLVFQF